MTIEQFQEGIRRIKEIVKENELFKEQREILEQDIFRKIEEMNEELERLNARTKIQKT
jgi:hypothetical protein